MITLATNRDSTPETARLFPVASITICPDLRALGASVPDRHTIRCGYRKPQQDVGSALLIPVTNAIEILHMTLRKIVKTRGSFPTTMRRPSCCTWRCADSEPDTRRSEWVPGGKSAADVEPSRRSPEGPVGGVFRHRFAIARPASPCRCRLLSSDRSSRGRCRNTGRCCKHH
jgi:hypothetical protein